MGYIGSKCISASVVGQTIDPGKVQFARPVGFGGFGPVLVAVFSELPETNRIRLHHQARFVSLVK